MSEDFVADTSPPFQHNTPKSLKEMSPYRIKILCLVIYISMERSKKWTRTFLTKWLKPSINQPRQTTHHEQTRVDGNLTELTTKNL